MSKTSAPAKAHRPQAYTVFGAAIVAGAAVAFGLNSALDSHLAQAKPQVESESILVALRPLSAGSPVTVWDVGLRDWPKAMVPSTALRVTDDLENLVVRHPLREGQPILAVQLGRVDTAGEVIARPLAVAAPPAPSGREPERDLRESPPPAPAPPLTSAAVPPATTVTTVSTTFATATTVLPVPAAVAPRVAATTATPAAAPVKTGNPGLATANQLVPAPPETALTTIATGTPTPATATSPIVEPSSDLDPLALPAVDAATTTFATATPALDAPAPIEIRSPRAERGDTPPAALRTALRPRPSVVQALSVPDRSALSDEGTGRVGEAAAPGRLSGRVASAAAGFGEGTAAPAPADATPRMLPTGSATSTQAPLAPQARSRATPPAPRPTRAQAFTKGYRPS